MEEKNLIDDLESNKDNYINSVLLSGILQEAVQEVKSLQELVEELERNQDRLDWELTERVNKLEAVILNQKN